MVPRNSITKSGSPESIVPSTLMCRPSHKQSSRQFQSIGRLLNQLSRHFQLSRQFQLIQSPKQIVSTTPIDRRLPTKLSRQLQRVDSLLNHLYGQVKLADCPLNQFSRWLISLLKIVDSIHNILSKERQVLIFSDTTFSGQADWHTVSLIVSAHLVRIMFWYIKYFSAFTSENMSVRACSTHATLMCPALFSLWFGH